MSPDGVGVSQLVFYPIRFDCFSGPEALCAFTQLAFAYCFIFLLQPPPTAYCLCRLYFQSIGYTSSLCYCCAIDNSTSLGHWSERTKRPYYGYGRQICGSDWLWRAVLTTKKLGQFWYNWWLPFPFPVLLDSPICFCVSVSSAKQLKEAPRKHQEKGIRLACLAHLGPEQVHIFYWLWILGKSV